MTKAREILEEMCWPTSYIGVESKVPVFTEHELSNHPFKWLKYMLLSKVGLEPIDEIGAQITRFTISELESAQELCFNKLKSNEAYGNMVVIKIVPWDSTAQLQSFRMFTTQDITPVFDKISLDFEKTDHEIWCCESVVDATTFSVGGRVTYPRRGAEQLLEIVWSASPKWLESANADNFPYAYLRATKLQNHKAFTVNTLHIPLSGPGSTLDEATMREDVTWIEECLNERTSKIQVLSSVLFALGAKEVCLPFKVSDGRFTIIDWDTEIESANAK